MVRQCVTELDHLIYPNSARGRRNEIDSRRSEFLGDIWVKFASAVAVVALIAVIVSRDGLDPPAALLAAASAVSNVGTAYGLTVLESSEAPTTYADLSSTSHVVLGLAMVFGRFEILALLALFNMAQWRR